MKRNEETKKDILSNQFEVENISDSFKELENLDDLWYFIKSASSGWIAGSAN